MKAPIVIIGIGELAGVFSLGFLRNGYPVYPITRDLDISQEYKNIPAPEFVLLAIQENELHPVLQQLPTSWLSKVGLIQNELLPKDWQEHQITNPTVTIVWFEKKKNSALCNILYSPSYGPFATLMSDALQAVGVPAPILESEENLLYELIRKALYILTVNIFGLLDNCTVENLWMQHQPLAREIAKEVILIMEFLTNKRLDQEKLINGMVEGIRDCPDRHCLGRTAFARLERVLKHAQDANLDTPKLREIYKFAKKGNQ